MSASRVALALTAVVLGMTVAGACGGAASGTPGAATPAVTGASALASGRAAPTWLLKRGKALAAQGKATRAWWTKTTLEEALRAVEPGHWQPLDARSSRPVYLLLMHGAFRPRSFLTGPPEPVPWGFVIIDAATHIADGSGGRSTPFDTKGLELHQADPATLRGE